MSRKSMRYPAPGGAISENDPSNGTPETDSPESQTARAYPTLPPAPPPPTRATAPRRPRIGLMVGYVLDEAPTAGQVRPAIITGVQNDITVTLQVFTRGSEDYLPNILGRHGVEFHEPDPKATSREETTRRINTWHYLSYEL